MINLRRIFNTSCRGTIDNSHVNLPRPRSGVQLSLLQMFFFLFLVLLLLLLFFSCKTYCRFHFYKLILGTLWFSLCLFFFFIFGLYIPFLLQCIFYKIKRVATCSHRLPFICLVQVNPLLSSQEHCSLGSCEWLAAKGSFPLSPLLWTLFTNTIM